MSWDVFVQDLSDVDAVAEIPDDFVLRSLGSRTARIAKLQGILPDGDFSDPSWGLLDPPGVSIEFNIAQEEDIGGFVMHVRGADEAVRVVLQILCELGLRALDSGSGSILPGGPPGMQEWLDVS